MKTQTEERLFVYFILLINIILSELCMQNLVWYILIQAKLIKYQAIAKVSNRKHTSPLFLKYEHLKFENPVKLKHEV